MYDQIIKLLNYTYNNDLCLINGFFEGFEKIYLNSFVIQ